MTVPGQPEPTGQSPDPAVAGAGPFSRSGDWSLHDVVAAKRAAGATVSVVLPALDEEPTVGRIVSTLLPLLTDHALVDELVVVDSGSTDRTDAVARSAGATVVAASEILPELGDVAGKGEALWKGLAATSGDLVVFIDADLETVGTGYVVALLGPLLADDGVALVKSFSDRPLIGEGTVSPSGGGRVTELVARPLLNLYWPHLSGIIGPLGGEYAARRPVLESIPFAPGYGVELAMLIDVAEAYGVGAIAQVDLGRRVHRHQSELALARMSAQVLQAAMDRLPGAPDAGTPTSSGRLVQFHRHGGRFVPTVHDVSLSERPPLHTLSGEQRAAARRTLADRIDADGSSDQRPVAG